MYANAKNIVRNVCIQKLKEEILQYSLLYTEYFLVDSPCNMNLFEY